MNQCNLGLKGRYTMEAVRPNGDRRVLLDWFENLILNSGLNRLGSGGAYDRCMVGTSATPVAASQTNLANSLAVTTNNTNTTQGVNVAEGYAWNRRVFRFPVGAATGNITEVGVGWSSTECFSRALTVDSGGSPVTVTVLADEYLDVTYELRAYWPTADVTGVLDISGTSYNVTTRAALVGTWVLGTLIESGANPANPSPGQAATFGAGALGDVTVDSGGAPQFNVNMSYVGSYSNNSYERTYRAVFSPSQGDNPVANLTFRTPFGIFKSSFAQVSGGAPIPKSSTNTLTLDYRATWARRP